jgi:hypothetical protein
VNLKVSMTTSILVLCEPLFFLNYCPLWTASFVDVVILIT